jgi:hypothetical protein
VQTAHANTARGAYPELEVVSPARRRDDLGRLRIPRRQHVCKPLHVVQRAVLNKLHRDRRDQHVACSGQRRQQQRAHRDTSATARFPSRVSASAQAHHRITSSRYIPLHPHARTPAAAAASTSSTPTAWRAMSWSCVQHRTAVGSCFQPYTFANPGARNDRRSYVIVAKRFVACRLPSASLFACACHRGAATQRPRRVECTFRKMRTPGQFRCRLLSTRRCSSAAASCQHDEEIARPVAAPRALCGSRAGCQAEFDCAPCC